MSSNIPYTHWAYFPDEASARRCADDLADYVTRIKQTEDTSNISNKDIGLCSYGEDQGAACMLVDGHASDHLVPSPGPEDSYRWLLLAGRDVAIDDMVERHNEVAAIVERHGGFYDGGESTYLEGKPVADPMLTGEWDTDGS